MNSICFPGAVNPFCRQSICLSSCSDQLALATSSSLVYLYSYTNQKLIFQNKFTPHSKSLSCMIFHPIKVGLLVTGGTPNSRINLWSIQEKTITKQNTFTLQRRPNALIWLTDNQLIIGDEHGTIYQWNEIDQKLIKFDNQSLSDKTNDEVHLFAQANKQNFIMAIAYKSGLVCICHVDFEKNHLNLLHKLSADISNTICCSIQFAHQNSSLDHSTLLYLSYAHGCIRVCDYINGKILSQLILVKQSKTMNLNDPRCKTYYPLIWIDVNTLLTGNLDGHLIKIDTRHSSHLEKSQFNIMPAMSGGKPIFSLSIKHDNDLFVYSYNRKLCIYNLSTSTLVNSLISIPGSVNSIQACPLQTTCIAIGVDTGNIGVLDLSGSISLSFLWQSIPTDVVRLAWHIIREGRIAYTTRLGHVALYDTLTGRSRVVYDWRYNQNDGKVNVLWGPLIPSATEDKTLAILYSIGDGKFHRWDSPEKTCVPTDLTSSVIESNNNSILTIAFSDDHKYLSVITSDGSLYIRTCPNLTLLQQLNIDCSPYLIHYHPRYLLSSIDLSTKQYWIAVNHKKVIRLIDTLNTNTYILNDLVGHTGDIECLAWSPSIDYLLASGSQDKTIRLWNVENNCPLKIYTEHTDVILSIMFSSIDSNFILSGSRDQSLHIWNIDQNTQLPDQPIISSIIDDEEETISNNGNKKRQNKPRPNRAEREKKRAAKQTNPIMNELNSLAFRLLWPSDIDRQAIADLSKLPTKTILIERIKQQNEKTKYSYHLLYWCNEYEQLINELNQEKITSLNDRFFWMTILNHLNEIQLLFDRTLDWISENKQENILEFLTMMIKVKRFDEIFEYLIQHEHIELSFLLGILLESMDSIRDRLVNATQTEDN